MSLTRADIQYLNIIKSLNMSPLHVLHVGDYHQIKYLGQSIVLELKSYTWTGACGIAIATKSSGEEFEAYISTLNYWPNDATWLRISRQPWKV